MKKIHYFLLGIGLSVACAQKPADFPTDEVLGLTPTKDTLTFVFAGDIMCHYPQVKSAKTEDGYDFDAWFQYIKPFVAEADLAFANLETTLSSRGPFRGYPRFKSPDALGVALADAGFDVIVTANNHSNDTGKRGVEHTIDVLNSLGLYHTGTFKNSLHREIHYPLIINEYGMKIVLLNYTYDTNGIPDRPPTSVNLIDTIQIKQDIDQALANSPDLILAFMHWGYEYNTGPNSKQKRIANMMIKAGVHHIIGAHPHVVQPIETSQGPKSQHLIAYSLGNFISNQNKPLTDGGIMVKMRLVKNGRETHLVDWEYIPVWRYKRPLKEGHKFEILPTQTVLDSVTFFERSRDYKAMRAYHDYISDHLDL